VVAQGNIVEIPIEFLRKFQDNPENAVLEYLCIPGGSVNPFFRNTTKIREAVHGDKSVSRPNPIDEETYVFSSDFKAGNDRKPRYMHIDLAINRNAVGMSMCHAGGFVKRRVMLPGQKHEVEASLPIVVFDFIARLKPRRAYGERDMDYDALLLMIEELAFERGFNLIDGLVTFDRFQSHMMISRVRGLNIPCALLSVDHTTSALIVDYSKENNIRREALHKQPSVAMGAFRDAFYQDRLVFTKMEMFDEYRTWLEKEVDEMQWNVDKQKAVKMEGGSDDLLQSAAGATFHCVNNATEIHIPEQVESAEDSQREIEFWKNTGRPDILMGETNEDGYIEDTFSAYGHHEGMGGGGVYGRNSAREIFGR